MGDVFLTGASGFVGGHVLDALLSSGYTVRALVHEETQLEARHGCTHVRGDVRSAGELVDAMRGCDHLVHTAALYSFAPSRRRQIMAVNVQGTAGLLEAARIAGVRKAVVTSSSAAVGPARDGRLATEEDWADAQHTASAYHRSKVLQERAALAARVPVVTVLPTAPVGPGDRRPTPTGRIILDLVRGRMPGTLGGGMNVVPVEDVARAHLLALERGRPRERYLVGGTNLSLAELWRLVASIAGRRPTSFRVPWMLAGAVAMGDEVRSRITNVEPRVPLEGVRMGRLRMFVSSEKAKRELGFEASPVQPAVERAVRWYRQHGYAG